MGEYRRRSYKEQRHYGYKPGINCDIIDADIKREKKMIESASKSVKFDKEKWDKGVSWFNEGFLLDEADNKLVNDRNFINGYNHAKRIKLVNDQLECYGRDWFLAGKQLDDANERYTSHHAFVKGYNDAKNESLSRRLGK